MEIVRERNIIPIKKKMTEIRKQRKSILHNYYLNCEKDDEIFVLYGKDSIVFWDNDRDVRRAYFYSCNNEELSELLKQVPQGVIIDYLTKVKGENQTFFENAGYVMKFEMHRMTACVSEEKKKEIAERRALLSETLYKKENVRPAVESDCDAIYKKLYEIFDTRESHLCTLEELMEFIHNNWVAVYYENGKLMGFHMFKIENNRFYGYQIWNGTGPEGYYSLTEMTNRMYAEQVKGIPAEKIKPSYAWVNVKNKKSKRTIEFWGYKFDGLYDFVYEKVIEGAVSE